MEQTNAHRSKYSPKGNISVNKTHKYNRIISKMFSGEGLFKTHRSNAKVDYKYYRDPNELVNRLRILVASRQSGSSAHMNEIIELATELYEIKLISKKAL